MGDWASYSPRDFLMFGPEVYDRLFVLQNAAVWPAPPAALALGALVGALALRGRPGHPAALLTLAAGWAGAAHFLALRYAPVNWPMEAAAAAFAVEAALLALLALRPEARGATGPARWIGLGLLGHAVVLHPLAGIGLGRPLAGAEIVGIAPDPTAVAGLAATLLLGRSGWTAALAIVPAAWCATSAAVLLALGSAQGWLLLAALGLWSAGRAVAERRRP